MSLTIEQLVYTQHHAHQYPEGFFKWLSDNQKIWQSFEHRALCMAAVRKRYLARTIIEVLRWNSDLREKNPLFKISNNMTPGMARLWMAKYGQRYPKFFSLQIK